MNNIIIAIISGGALGGIVVQAVNLLWFRKRDMMLYKRQKLDNDQSLIDSREKIKKMLEDQIEKYMLLLNTNIDLRGDVAKLKEELEKLKRNYEEIKRAYSCLELENEKLKENIKKYSKC